MKDYKVINNTAIITYSIEESTTKQDPFYLQNLMYDLPFDSTMLDSLIIHLIIPTHMKTFIIDDLHFVHTKSNSIEFVMQEASQLIYQLFVANHQLCNLCPKKALFDCQPLPSIFEKTIKVTLKEAHAQAFIKCHYLGDQASECNITTIQHHQASHTTSKLTVKGVLDEQAKLISDNTIVVDNHLEKIIAEQNNKNLMLHNKAHAIAIPKLIINSQQVECKHGATAHSLDQETLFYLQSRGIEQEEAIRILIDAFLTHEATL